jgi:hypothetical protein
MTSAERMKAVREVEKMVQRIVAKGWRCEKIETCDEGNEPFRVAILLSTEGYDREPEKGIC